VPQTSTSGTPATVRTAVVKRRGSSPSVSAPTSPRARGPWTASIANASIRSVTVASVPAACSVNQARSRAWLAAFVTVR
jgi:hypothetical protein